MAPSACACVVNVPTLPLGKSGYTSIAPFRGCGDEKDCPKMPVHGFMREQTLFTDHV